MISSSVKFQYETSYSDTFGHYPKALDKAVASLETIPKVRDLLKKLVLEGGIGIETTTELLSGDKGGWHNEKRVILFNQNDIAEDKLTLAEKIEILTFEICNASRTKVFQLLYGQAEKRGLSINAYVERVEKMEHLTALQCKSILNEGVELGTIPDDKSFKSYCSEDFNEYYAFQQAGGHSQRIASRYQSLFPDEKHQYTGTVCHLNTAALNILYKMLTLNNYTTPTSEEWKPCVSRMALFINDLRMSQDPNERAVVDVAKKIFTQGIVAAAMMQNIRIG